MANYTNTNSNLGMQPMPTVMSQQQQTPLQFPYGNNNMLLSNSPYDNYMGRVSGSQNLLSNQFLKCRPVASKEEASAYQIDLDGSLWVFTDVGNGKIYTKQVNNDGTASFKTYALTKDEKPHDQNDYVTKEEFNKVIQGLIAALPPSEKQKMANGQIQNNTNGYQQNETLMNFG